MPIPGAANAVKVEATGGRAHNLDGVSEPYNGGTRHARCADAKYPTYYCSNFLSCARIAAGGGVFYGTQTPSPQMPLMQKMVYHRSAQSPSPAVLHADTLPQGQQDFEPQAMVGKTEELETMGRSG